MFAAAALADNLVNTATIADGAVTLNKLRTQPIARNTVSIGAGRTVDIAVSTALPVPQAPPLTHVLISAFSPTANARFNWAQGSITTSGRLRPGLPSSNR